MSEPELMPATGSAIAEFNATAAGLAQLQAQLADATIDCATPAGDKVARESRRSLVQLRVALEDKRVELKQPHLDAGRLIDAEAKRITGAILELELPIDTKIKAEEKRKEAEREAKAAAERARHARNQELVAAVRALPLSHTRSSSAKLADALVELETQTFAVDDDYQVDLAEARIGALEQLDLLRLQAVDREAEAARLAEQQAELNRQQAELQRQQAEAKAAQRAQDEAAAAERKRLDDEAAAVREAEAQAERDRLAQQQAEFERIRQAQQAEAARLEAQRQEQAAAERKRLAQAEARAIKAATVHEAAHECLALMANHGLDGELPWRKLAAALERDTAKVPA